MNTYKALAYKSLNRAVSRLGSYGYLEEQINCNRRTGVLRPVGSKSLVQDYTTNLTDYDLLYRHPVLSNNDLIGVRQELGQVHRIHAGGTPHTTTIFTMKGAGVNEVIKGITHLGNVLVISTDIARYFIKYDPTTDIYSRMQNIPVPKFYLTSDLDLTRIKSIATLPAKDTWDEAVSEMVSTRSEVGKEGYFEGHILAIAAWKMADGSFIKASPPVHGYFGYNGCYLSEADGSTGVTYQWKTMAFHKIEGKHYFTGQQIADLATWKGQITSLCFFITRPKSDFIEDGAQESYVADGDDYYPPRNVSELKKLIEEASYYQVHEIPIQSVLDDNDATFDIEIGNLDTLMTRPVLPVDQGTHHEITGETSLQFNNRLHLGGCRTVLSDGYNLEAYIETERAQSVYGLSGYDQASQSDDILMLYTYIATEQGEKIVKTQFYPNKWTKNANPTYLLLNPVFCYPDYRATKMTIYTYHVATDTYYLVQTVNLRPHPFLNYALSLNWDTYIGDPGPLKVQPITGTVTASGNLPNEDTVYFDDNRIQVSLPDNPFVYPAENSYRVGSLGNQVVAIRGIGEAISSGQFGQFPLYVFTTGGIWTLQQGDGSVLYTSVNPLSADVVSSEDRVVSTGRGVAFITARGMYLMEGNQRKEISVPLEGKVDNPLSSQELYLGYLDDYALVQLSEKLCSVDFLTYLQTSILGFDPQHQEIIVSKVSEDSIGNADGEYSFVYSTENGEWYKIGQNFIRFLSAYPDSWGVDFDKVYSMGQEEATDREVLIQTRPFILGKRSFNKIISLVHSGMYEVTDEHFAGVYLYGSQDGQKWFLLSGVQQGNTLSEMMARGASASCKYFILVFASSLSLDSVIDGAEFEYQERYGGGLR